MKLKPLIIFLILLTPILLMQPVSAQNGAIPPSINKPEYYYTQVYYREIEGVRIYIECPMTESNLANQNVTFRIIIFGLQQDMEIVLIKNAVTQTLKRTMNAEDYYTFGIYIDNPIGTNCSLEFILKTNWGDFEILNLIYIISLRDPSLEYSQEIIYWTENITEAVEEEFKRKEEERLFKTTLSTLYFYIIFCLAMGFIVSFIGMYMGRHGARRTRIKPCSIRENGIIRSLFVIVFTLTFLAPGVLFYEPITIISEEATKAKYLGYEFITPIPYQELVYLFLQCFIFIIMMWAWFVFYIYGWKTQPLKDSVVPVIVNDKVHNPDVDIDITTEEVTVDKDKNGIEREIKTEDLTMAEAWKRYIHSIEVTCPKIIVKNRPLRDDLRVRIDGLKAVLLDFRGKEKPDRLNTELERLNTELDALLTKKESKDKKISLTEKLKLKLLQSKLKESKKKDVVWVMSHGHANRLRMMADMRAYPKLVEDERKMEIIAYDAMNYANQSNREGIGKVVDEASPDEFKSLEEELLESRVKRNREKFKDSASDVQTHMLAPSSAQISD